MTKFDRYRYKNSYKMHEIPYTGVDDRYISAYKHESQKL